jgi:hypothetical protein
MAFDTSGRTALSEQSCHLTLLLRRGDVQAAKQYRQMLGSLGDEVRTHLRLAAAVLAEVQPAPRQRTAASCRVP